MFQNLKSLLLKLYATFSQTDKILAGADAVKGPGVGNLLPISHRLGVISQCAGCATATGCTDQTKLLTAQPLPLSRESLSRQQAIGPFCLATCCFAENLQLRADRCAICHNPWSFRVSTTMPCAGSTPHKFTPLCELCFAVTEVLASATPNQRCVRFASLCSCSRFILELSCPLLVAARSSRAVVGSNTVETHWSQNRDKTYA